MGVRATIPANWRDPLRYPAARDPLTAFAWEFLRRNGDYRTSWGCLSVDELARDFGLRQPRDPDNPAAPPAAAWHDGWDPPPGLLEATLVVEGAFAGARARVIEELRRQARAAEFERLVVSLGPLRVGDPARLVRGLRSLDGRRAGASDVDLAETLFQATCDAHAYPYSSARTRARHAWQEAERFIAGRYRLLALAPDRDLGIKRAA